MVTINEIKWGACLITIVRGYYDYYIDQIQGNNFVWIRGERVGCRLITSMHLVYDGNEAINKMDIV